MRRLLLFFVALGSALYAAERPTLKIGVVAPLTGSNSYMGQMGKAGLDYKLKELSNAGKYNYQVIYEDDGFVFSRTALAIKKLKDIDHADVIMTMWGYGSEIALPILKDSQVFHLNVDRWTAGNGHNDFAVGCSLKVNVEKTVEVLKALGYKKIAYIGTADQGAEMYLKLLLKRLPEEGIQVPINQTFSVEVRDLRTWILKTREQKPDAILQIAAMPVCQVLLKQMKELGCQIPVVHATSAAMETDKELREGQVFVYPAAATPQWEEKFKKATGLEGNYPAPQFYNTITLLDEALKRFDGQRKPTPQELSAAMQGLERYQGATGTLYYSPPDRYDAPVDCFVFKNGLPVSTPVEKLPRTPGAGR